MIPCEKIKYCNQCCRQYIIPQKKKKKKKRGEEEEEEEAYKGHVCSVSKCHHCGEPIPSDTVQHECFIQPYDRLKKRKRKGRRKGRGNRYTTAAPVDDDDDNSRLSNDYIFYDFETRVHEGRHEANFVAAKTSEGEEWYANGTDCVGEFVRRYRTGAYRLFTFIAHNASGFDSYLVLEYMTKQGIIPFIVMKGSRVVMMRDDAYSQRWVDSFSFLPMRLAKAPEALDFEDMAKGHFPHKFNTRANESYVGAYPEISYYGYDSMTSDQKTDFAIWYRSVRHKKFDIQKQLRRYCVNDVRILHTACGIYRENFIECATIGLNMVHSS
jgi:hypothetical protein